jgi:vacuolar-type H+-ATPase subunit E/Vma4
MTYQNPLAGVTDRFIRAANQAIDDPGVLISTENAKEGIQRIQTEARKATRAIKEGAQNRIDSITRDAQEPALGRVES